MSAQISITREQALSKIEAGVDVLAIRMNHSNAGLFAQVTFALNQLIYSEAQGLVPVVMYGEDSEDGPNAYFDATQGDNIWEYYFEPVAGLSWQDIQALLADKSHPLTPDRVVRLSTGELWRLHTAEPDSVYNYPYGMHRERYAEPGWYDSQRERAQRVVRDYIRVRPDILAETERAAEGLFQGRPVLGMHLRGTDKGTADSDMSLMRIVPPDEYFPHIETFLSTHPDACLFVATDQSQFVETIRQRFGERVVSMDAMRASGAVNVFQTNKGNYQSGREVLMDMLLLSKSDFLLKCTSAVGEYAMYFNPSLKCVDLNHSGKKLSWWRRRKITKHIRQRHAAQKERHASYRQNRHSGA